MDGFWLTHLLPQHTWPAGQHCLPKLQTWAGLQQVPLMHVWVEVQHFPLQTFAFAQQVPLMHVWAEVQQLLPQRVVVGGQNGRGYTCCAARPREARPRPRAANRAPPTAPPTSLNVSRLEIGLAVILDMSSKSAPISILPLTAPAATGESQ